MTGIVCNFCAICIDSDCQFEHSISLKDRKVVRRLYDGLVSPNKTEPKNAKRRANCKFGQICFTSYCEFRHGLNFADRMKLVNGFNSAKLDMMKTEKVIHPPRVNEFIISSRNSFSCLEESEYKQSWADISSEFPDLIK